ncbi:NADH-ubiquinone oxidoreductase [Fulvia fulva]|uniref:NADH-ubiquinone oxidoreductase n=1 Tax=Passalora fulva TaxID=5499 RepID=A0A9Q8P3A5_PASFU|nr:NADH-ubiquinone oxidoreductase [Fulvia fulva]KAK4636342.1 NADH-ubiquinone oxidoreductase [Fulvia fulva]KAK4637293.1 NADH-ubiquinone oxidoreductase [Fulvia fulva]UJO11507.1 NADH-ubiquinone oxidoreductase [Fulvia fulva]WPV09849.1 NADH-ubiquinone oxidoreductase [Fulvia fulva]WPV23148.1 NADH-ubiquinone oxidoreductase [Fulvia fulva]
MQPLQRTALRSARQVRSRLSRQRRRNVSDHGHGAHDAHAAPANESFGKGFYTTISAIPLSLALYKLSSQGTDEQPYFTRLITKTYAEYKTKWAQRNDFHTQAVEQAAADRVLFLTETNQSNVRHVDLRFPEQLNVGSPWNVPAGHGFANMDELIKKYETENFAENEKKLQQLRDNKVPVEQPFESFSKTTPAVDDS